VGIGQVKFMPLAGNAWFRELLAHISQSFDVCWPADANWLSGFMSIMLLKPLNSCRLNRTEKFFGSVKLENLCIKQLLEVA